VDQRWIRLAGPGQIDGVSRNGLDVKDKVKQVIIVGVD